MTTLDYLGLPGPRNIAEPNILRAHFVVPLLFLGPLYTAFLNGMLPFQRNWTFYGGLVKRFGTLAGFRNYIMVCLHVISWLELNYFSLGTLYRRSHISCLLIICVASCWL